MKLPELIITTALIASGLSPAWSQVSLSKTFEIRKPIGGRDFMNPQSVFVDRIRKDIYVADTGNGRVQILTKDGHNIGSFEHRPKGITEGSTEPTGIAVDSKGSIYVTDTTSRSILVYDYRGRLQRKLNVPGLTGEPPVFGRMAIDSRDSLYVVMKNKGAVCVIDPKGASVRTVGSYGKGQGKFEMVADAAVDASGRIYVLDSLGTPSVQVFDPEGKFLFGFGMHATGKGNFAHPTAIEVDTSGRIWVVDSFAQIINVYDSQGKFLTYFTGYFFPIDLTYLPGLDRLYVVEKNGGRLLGYVVQQ